MEPLNFDMFSSTNMGLVATTLTLIAGFRKMFPKVLDNHWGERLVPVLPFIVAVLAAQAGFCQVTGNWVAKLQVGVLAGSAAAALFKVANTTVMGNGVQAKAVVVAPAAPVIAKCVAPCCAVSCCGKECCVNVCCAGEKSGPTILNG